MHALQSQSVARGLSSAIAVISNTALRENVERYAACSLYTSLFLCGLIVYTAQIAVQHKSWELVNTLMCSDVNTLLIGINRSTQARNQVRVALTTAPICASCNVSTYITVLAVMQIQTQADLQHDRHTSESTCSRNDYLQIFQQQFQATYSQEQLQVKRKSRMLDASKFKLGFCFWMQKELRRYCKAGTADFESLGSRKPYPAHRIFLDDTMLGSSLSTWTSVMYGLVISNKHHDLSGHDSYNDNCVISLQIEWGQSDLHRMWHSRRKGRL